MKQQAIFGAAFFVSLILMVLLAETIWAIPFCFIGMIISFVLGRLWKEVTLMQLVRLDGIRIEVYNAELTEEEIRQYISRARLARPSGKLIRMTLVVDGEDVEITSEYEAVPFERIRRITGYLVGRLTRANSAKSAEIADRTANDIDRDLADVLAEVAHATK